MAGHLLMLILVVLTFWVCQFCGMHCHRRRGLIRYAAHRPFVQRALVFDYERGMELLARGAHTLYQVYLLYYEVCRLSFLFAYPVLSSAFFSFLFLRCLT